MKKMFGCLNDWQGNFACASHASMQSSKEKMLEKDVSMFERLTRQFRLTAPSSKQSSSIFILPIYSAFQLVQEAFVHCYEFVFEFVELGVEFFECFCGDLFGCGQGVELRVAFGCGTQGDS
ncbi:MAG: hypothetical protein U5R06_03745 [candidate division KSB1 bacterium]|nr:hypothetical protein [candidate division KSB1 bacterium]